MVNVENPLEKRPKQPGLKLAETCNFCFVENSNIKKQCETHQFVPNKASCPYFWEILQHQEKLGGFLSKHGEALEAPCPGKPWEHRMGGPWSRRTLLGCQEPAAKPGRLQPTISPVKTCPLGPAWLSEKVGQSK